jgi:hypothetical protein
VEWRLYAGILWRSIACGPIAGAAAGAAYGLLLSLPFVGVQSSLVGGFTASGALYGTIAGALAGVTSGAAIAILTALRRPPRTAVDDYVNEVRRTAALCTLVLGLGSFAFLGFITLTIAGLFVYAIPTIIGTLIAYRLAPLAVRWYLRRASEPAAPPGSR